jgi:S-adenosylmethionine hydrolase
MSIITLLTDFGLDDVYVGVMKGAIALINPKIQVIDLTHQIPPQNIIAARFAILNSYTYFPPDTVHIAVVDPGVGTHRRPIALKTNQGYFVGPDNGIFSGIFNQVKIVTAIELNNSKYWLTPNPSHTFHGRDIFAPVGAYLATKKAIENLGTKINPDTLVKLNLPEYTKNNNQITACIQYIDHFGNIITNIPANLIQGKNWSLKINNISIPQGITYNSVKTGELISLIGSHGWLEIASNCGHATQQLNLQIGDKIKLIIDTNQNLTI